MKSDLPAELETDPRFPSGPWTGFFLQKAIPGRHRMELRLMFRAGTVTGEGRDWVGAFVLHGRYTIEDGRCYWVKRYLGKHDVHYRGFNEGRGIWGLWEMTTETLPEYAQGGFHIWPEGMPDPTQPQLTEEADPPMPVHVEEWDQIDAPVFATPGVDRSQ